MPHIISADVPSSLWSLQLEGVLAGSVTGLRCVSDIEGRDSKITCHRPYLCFCNTHCYGGEILK
jgi:hypothetical protein